MRVLYNYPSPAAQLLSSVKFSGDDLLRAPGLFEWLSTGYSQKLGVVFFGEEWLVIGEGSEMGA